MWAAGQREGANLKAEKRLDSVSNWSEAVQPVCLRPGLFRFVMTLHSRQAPVPRLLRLASRRPGCLLVRRFSLSANPSEVLKFSVDAGRR